MFWKKKIKSKIEYDEIIGLSNTKELIFPSSNNYLLIIGRAILCLLLTIGSICGYASSFGAQFNLWLIFAILAVTSLLIAYFKNHKNALLKNCFYIVFLFLFSFSIFSLYKYVNSGYHALVNLTYASLEIYLDIPALVHYEEIIENSYSTITYFLVFLGIFELFVFHIQISDRFSMFKIFLLSFTPYIVPLFINLIPENFYIICLMTAYISCIFLQTSHHACRPRKSENNYTVYYKSGIRNKKLKGFSYTTNGLNYIFSIGISFLISMLIFAIVTVTVPYSVYQRNEHNSSLKESVTDEVKYFVTFGLSGLFNRYTSTGGLNDGKLGGIYSVRPDYQTDLTVKFVPLSTEPTYLRGFVGTAYTDRQWYNSTQIFNNLYVSEKDYKTMCEYDALVSEFIYIKDKYPGATQRMDITNIGANPKYEYSPYYTNPEQISIYKKDAASQYPFLLNRTKSYNFYPYYEKYINNLDYSNISYNSDNIYNYPVISGYYEFYSYPYLQVPEKTREEIVTFLNENNLCLDYLSSTGSTYAKLTGDELDNVINQVSETLSNEFVYSLNPGITPRNEDYVGYFLNENQKGFCAHFATSATLIFRTLGIPARYVEGYVITSDDLQDAKIIENEPASSYIDTSIINMDFSVVDVNIADDKAHAWVEYFDPEFGWRVFEATTASMEDTSGYDFWSSLYGFLNDTSIEENNSESDKAVDSSTVADILYRIFIIVILLILICVITFYMYYGIKQYRSYHRSRNNINVRNYYKIISRRICKKYPEFNYIITTNEQLEFIMKHYKISKKFIDKDIPTLALIIEKSAFAKTDISYSEFQYAMKMMKILRRNVTLFH